MTGMIAIVDDDARFTEYVQVFLRTRGYQCEVFHSGGALLDAMKTRSVPTVVLLDVTMPGLTGIETLRTLRSTRPDMQVIMLSGRQAPATIVEAVRLGAADYVLKPGDADGLGEAALESALRRAFEREALTNELTRLISALPEDPDGSQACWSHGSAMQEAMSIVDRVADSDVDVLIRGESGVGKEVVARQLHQRSARRTKPLVKLNCAALPADLLESELFGHERGAFTGAATTRIGKFEFAQHGTIMLDEIGEMPAALQAKLLHVLQDRAFTKLGSNRQIEVDVRVIAATNRDLEAMMRAQAFREDLYYRLQVIEIHVPSLRDRREEIPSLAEFFLQKFARVYHRPPVRPSAVFMDRLVNYPWPGNIRELENLTKRFVVLQDETLILNELARMEHASSARAATVPARAMDPAVAGVTEADAPSAHRLATNHKQAPGPTAENDGAAPLDLQALAKFAAMQAEREAINIALERFRWNRRKAAAHLSVSYKTLLNKMKELKISDGATPL